MPRRCDIWRTGVVRAPIDDIVRRGGLAGLDIAWLTPEPSFTFLADPFGLWRGGRLHLFVEQYDYRTRHGVILCLVFDEAMNLLDRRPALREPWHLSYPFVFEADGETWMLPEAYRSGTLTLYRATAFPFAWEPVATLPLDGPAIDPTPFRHDGRWWLFYTGSADKAARQAELRIATADSLLGPWTPHPANPVRYDRRGSRPAGTPLIHEGAVHLPVQDCARTYGGGVRMLRFASLATDPSLAELGDELSRPAGPPIDGMHTLSSCGAVTLIDVKRIDRTAGGLAIDLVRGLNRLSRSAARG